MAEVIKRRVSKGTWDGNGWPCLDFLEHAPGDFARVLMALRRELAARAPLVSGDGFQDALADLDLDGTRAVLSLDVWGLSIACEDEEWRDRLFEMFAADDKPRRRVR
jgi:hypothetical protein